MVPFELDELDHVAIRVKDMERSADWYGKVLGLKKTVFPKWGDFPIFLLAGKTGVALFPAHEEDTKLDAKSLNVKIDHFAFHVSQTNFKKARAHYEALGIAYRFVDHGYFVSIYTFDPDGHEVELTSITSEGETFLAV